MFTLRGKKWKNSVTITFQYDPAKNSYNYVSKHQIFWHSLYRKISEITNDKILWCANRNTFEFQISTTHPKTFINKMIEFKKEQKQNSDILSFVCLARPNVATNYTFAFLVQWLSIMEDKNRNHFLPKKDIYTLLHRNVASFQRLI